MFDKRPEDARKFCFIGDADGVLESIGLRGFDKIFFVQRFVGPTEALGKIQPLPLTDHAVAAVIEDENLHRQVIRGDRLELSKIHPDAAVAIHVDHQPVGTCELRSDGGRQSKTHRAHGS